MTFQHFVAAMRRGWLLIVLFTLIGAVAGAVLTAFRSAEYNSTVSVLMSPAAPNDASELAQGASYVAAQMDTYAALVDKSAVLQPVVARDSAEGPTIEELGSMISVNVPSGSTVMEITVTAENPEEAARLASSIPEALQLAITSVVPADGGGDPFVRVIEVQEPAVPSMSTTAGPLRNGFIGALVGLVAGALIAMARYVAQVRKESAPYDRALATAPASVDSAGW